MNCFPRQLGNTGQSVHAAALLALSAVCSHAQTVSSLAVTSASLETFNTSRAVPIGTSGSAANFALTTPDSGSVVGRFRLTDLSNNQAFADLAIRYDGTRAVSDYSTIPLSGLMVVRTEDSQNLTDSGTISFLVNQSVTSLSRFTFDWYTPDGLYNTPKSVAINVTTFDIDFRQQVRVNETNIQTLRLATGSRLSYATGVNAGGSVWTQVYDAGNTDSNFNEPLNATQFLTRSGSSQTIEMGKTSGNGNALFMFEFRTPSAITPNLSVEVPVPEPSTYAVLLGLAAGCVALTRRGKRSNA